MLDLDIDLGRRVDDRILDNRRIGDRNILRVVNDFMDDLMDAAMDGEEPMPPSVVLNMTDPIKRRDVHTEEDRERYIAEHIIQYPWLFVDFEIEESHINDATDGEHHKTPGKSTHDYAKPREC